MVAQYRKGKKSPWLVQIRNASGEINSACFATKETALEFEKKEREKRQRQKRGLRAPREEILFIDFTRTWLEKRFKSMPHSTVSQDNSRIRNYWLPLLANKPLEHIQTDEILAGLDRIQFELGHSSADRNRHRALLHKLFQDAFIQNKIDINPVKRIPLVDENRKTRKSSFLKPEEQKKYLQELYNQGSQYGILGMILLFTGARISSAIAAQYQDVDFNNNIFRIRRLYERSSKTIIERQKDEGEGGETIVPLFPRLKEAILEHKKNNLFIEPTCFIACQSSGKFISPDTFKDVHARVIKNTQITRVTIHDLRRSFAMNALRAGYSKSDVKEILGHSSELVTEKYTLKDISHLVEKGKKLGFGKDIG